LPGLQSKGNKPLVVDIRRSISSSYYAAFHHAIATYSGLLLGKSSVNKRVATSLASRAFTHSRMAFVHRELSKTTLPNDLKVLFPGNLDNDLQDYAELMSELYERRLEADYDWEASIYRADAGKAHKDASRAIELLKKLNKAKTSELYTTASLCLFGNNVATLKRFG